MNPVAPQSNAGRLYRKEDLVARFGAHWSVAPDSERVEEVLGARDKSVTTQFDTMREAIGAARRAKLRRLRLEGAEAQLELADWRLPFRTILAKWRLLPDGKRFLAKVERLRAQVAAAEAGIGDWEPMAMPRKKELRGPVRLGIGHEIWRVRANWPQLDGLRVEGFSVTAEMLLDSGRKEDGFDVRFAYVAGQGNRQFQFTYDRGDENDPALPINAIGEWVFLTYEAAAAKVAELTEQSQQEAEATKRIAAQAEQLTRRAAQLTPKS